MRSSVVVAGVLLVVAASVAEPASARQAPGWVSPPVSVQQKVVKVLNSEAVKQGGQAHGAGCFSMWALRGHPEVVTVSFKRNLNPAACGSNTGVGVQVYRMSGSRWSRIAQTSGPAGTACTYVGKVGSGVKALLKKSGLCA